MRTDFHAALAKPYEWGEHITLRALDFERDVAPG